jgi:predicted permease
MARVFRRLRHWFGHRQLQAELAEELEAHRAMRQEQLERSGMTPTEAVHASRRALGNVTLASEDARNIWIWPWIESVGQDLRLGFRGLIKRPGFTLVAVLTMALGIGANTAVFSLLDASLLRVLPARDPHELVFLLDVQPKGRSINRFSSQTFERFRAESRSLAGLVAYDPSRFSVTIDGEAEMRRGEFVNGHYFDMLGIRAVAGRLFTAADDAPGRDPVAVISDRFWASRFDRDTSVVGRTVSVGKTTVTVVGVTPREFQGRELTSGWSDITLPMFLKPQLGLRDHVTFGLMGRLKAGIPLEQAAEELSMIRRQDYIEGAGAPSSAEAEQQLRNRGIQLRSAMRGELPLLGAERPNDTKQVRLIVSAVLVVLLVSCVNIACLLLARAASRQKEIAVRLAIGASRGRLIRQLLTESLLLACLGGAAGVLTIGWTAAALGTVLPVGELPYDPRQDVRTLGFALGASLLTGILFGVVPALAGTRIDLTPVMQRSDGGTRRGALRHRLAKSLVVAQIALSLALLAGAGLIIRSLARLYTVRPGFASNEVLTAWIYPTLLGFDHSREMRFYRDLLDSLNKTPGIRSAGLARFSITRGDFNIVAPGFFETLGIDIVEGRDFLPTDTESAPKVAIIGESVARKFFPNQSPIGQFVPKELERFFRGRAEIVGVVREIRTGYRQRTSIPGVYAAYTQAPPSAFGQMSLYVRSTVAPLSALPAVREAIRSVEPDLALFDVRTVTDQLDDSVASERSTATLLGCFGALALVLASIGLFGTMSHSVASRTKELGIRMSLGADRGQMLRMVLRESMVVVAIGLVIGIPVALASARLVANLLVGIEQVDALTMSTVVALLSLVTVLAAYFPARRASRVDPMVALRYE